MSLINSPDLPGHSFYEVTSRNTISVSESATDRIISNRLVKSKIFLRHVFAPSGWLVVLYNALMIKRRTFSGRRYRYNYLHERLEYSNLAMEHF